MTRIPKNKILVGDAREKIQELPENSIDMVMTSPPYWGLRDYGHKDQIGLEETPEKYVKHLIEVFNELKRVLKPTGTFYLNLGDTYSGGGGINGVPDDWDSISTNNREKYNFDKPSTNMDLPSKCMSMIPERVMMAMVDSGWILRNKIIWDKPNPMPESVKDRYSTSYEFIYMFSLNKQYYFDLDAVREPYDQSSIDRVKQNDGHPVFNGDKKRGHPEGSDTLNPDQFTNSKGKNPGDVWHITTKPFSEAHFAVYPPELCEKPIRASCPKKVCVECGKPWERDVEVEREKSYGRGNQDYMKASGFEGNPQRDVNNGFPEVKDRKTKGWKSTCDCSTDKTGKGIILDPFAGAGTTCLVARKFNRNYIGIEINEEYAEMARKRIKNEIGGQPLDRFVGMKR